MLVMDASLIGDLVARDRRSEFTALIDAGIDRVYSYFDFCNTANKAANVLRHVGVRRGDRVLILSAPEPQPILTFFGATQLGSVVLFAETIDVPRPEGISAIVHPTTRKDDIETVGSERLISYGDPPEAPNATHWETEVWSENPATVPPNHRSGDTALDTGRDGTQYTHEQVLRSARVVIDRFDVQEGARVALKAPLTDPRTVVAGLVMPLLVGGSILLPKDDLAEAGVVVTGQNQRERDRVEIPIEAVEI